MLTVNENYRLKKLTLLAINYSTVTDIGFAQKPNRFLKNSTVIGIDADKGISPSNYTWTFKGDLTNYLLNDKNPKADAVIAGEVIEHVRDPINFLIECKACLNTTGRLIRSTPTSNSQIEQALTLSLSRKYFYNEDHIYIFPQRWLIRSLDIAGFDNVKLYSGGGIPGIGTIPFPHPWCHQTIEIAQC